MEENVSPVILIEKINVDPEEFDLFLKAWAEETNKFKKQPGFILTQLYKGIGGSGTFIVYAVWESAEHFKMAVNRLMDPNSSNDIIVVQGNRKIYFMNCYPYNENCDLALANIRKSIYSEAMAA
jgi:quinol monooxygenase YgiN